MYVLHVMKSLTAESPVTSAFHRKEDRSVNNKGLRTCAHPATINDLVDNLTDFAFHRATQLHNFIDIDFPFEKLLIKHHGKKITGNICRETSNLTGEQSAVQCFETSGRISRENF